MVDTDELVGFEAQIKPLFREGDRDAMQAHFDLWSYGDVSEHADAILSPPGGGQHAVRRPMAPSPGRPLPTMV